MGKLLPSFKKAVLDEIIDNISSNTTQYYAVAANPVAYSGNTPVITNDDYSTLFINNWNMMFGKRIFAVDVIPVINKFLWISNTVYNRYDDNNQQLYSSNSKFYAITEPSSPGGDYKVYKCIDNSNNAVSTSKPNIVQSSTFQTSDGYKWRYITSITYSNFYKFSTDEYSPIYVNTSISTAAQTHSGVEVVMIVNGGIGYATYHNGNIVSVINTSVIQIESGASSDNDFYTKGSIYIYNTDTATSQLFDISKYVSNTTGKWIYLNGIANTNNIEPNSTQYKIAPKVNFTSDGDTQPSAYCTINSTSNSIDMIVMLDYGSNIRRANVSIVSNTVYGSGANLYPIIPPPGGHGSDPTSELDVKGLAISFNFTGSETNNIVTSNAIYNKIGLIKNPYYINTNGTKGNSFFGNTFSQILKANVSPTAVFDIQDQVTGLNSKALGTVVFSNSTVLYLTGDKTFDDGETIVSSNGSVSTTISINTIGDVYVKDLRPLYVQNINNINRLESQTESFKLIIKL